VVEVVTGGAACRWGQAGKEIKGSAKERILPCSSLRLAPGRASQQQAFLLFQTLKLKLSIKAQVKKLQRPSHRQVVS
jgi:hypothetical protein